MTLSQSWPWSRHAGASTRATNPVFWRLAPDAADRQRPYLEILIADVSVVTLVAICDEAMVGFLIGQLVAAPVVYDPGGRTCVIDDFTVEHPASWATVGIDLLKAAQEEARQRGAAQVVVVCGHLDQAKRAALDSCQLAIASQWWVAPLAQPTDGDTAAPSDGTGPPGR